MFKSSKLYDQDTFYAAFKRDLRHCRRELIIESPFITTRRANALLPILARLRKRNVSIIVNTRDEQCLKYRVLYNKVDIL